MPVGMIGTAGEEAETAREEEAAEDAVEGDEVEAGGAGDAAVALCSVVASDDGFFALAGDEEEEAAAAAAGAGAARGEAAAGFVVGLVFMLSSSLCMRSALSPDESRPRDCSSVLRSPTFIFLMSAEVRDDIAERREGRRCARAMLGRSTCTLLLDTKRERAAAAEQWRS